MVFPDIYENSTWAECDETIQKFFTLFPNLTPLSLDEYVHEYWEILPEDARNWAISMVDYYSSLNTKF